MITATFNFNTDILRLNGVWPMAEALWVATVWDHVVDPSSLILRYTPSQLLGLHWTYYLSKDTYYLCCNTGLFRRTRYIHRSSGVRP